MVKKNSYSDLYVITDKNINSNNADKRQIYEKYISQIRNYILEQNKWIEIIEIEQFFHLKRRGKLI